MEEIRVRAILCHELVEEGLGHVRFGMRNATIDM